jgi:GNAT superfamily N-acetyltransferase
VTHPLDDPVRASLTGAHAHLAQRRGNILRYPPDLAPFVSIPHRPTAADWADAAALLSSDGEPAPMRLLVAPPDDWSFANRYAGVQMVGDGIKAEPDDEAIPLGPADVPEIRDLVARTEPGPFRARTVELGTYLGIRREGVLVAMAGERMHPPGWSEISAVCTDEAHRGQGLATRLIGAIAAVIAQRGEVPFLHAAASVPSR